MLRYRNHDRSNHITDYSRLRLELFAFLRGLPSSSPQAFASPVGRFKPSTQASCGWAATGRANGGDCAPNSEELVNEEVPSPNPEDGNADDMVCEKSANWWFNMASIGSII